MAQNWIFITAGFYPEAIKGASVRLSRQATTLFDFSKIIVINPNNVREICPILTSKYPEFFSEHVPGFGFGSWKIEAVARALAGEFGQCEGVVWADAGCEIYSNLFTRFLFRKLLRKTYRKGYSVFELATPEISVTKKSVFKWFSLGEEGKNSGQVQATYFALSGPVGKLLASSVLECILADFNNLNPELLDADEDDRLVLSKCEQSIFSVACKVLGANARMRTPPAGNRGRKSLIKAFFAPVWVARNRFPETIVPKWMRMIPTACD